MDLLLKQLLFCFENRITVRLSKFLKVNKTKGEAYID